MSDPPRSVPVMVAGGLHERFAVEPVSAGPGAPPASDGSGAGDFYSFVGSVMTQVLHRRDDDDFMWALGDHLSNVGENDIRCAIDRDFDVLLAAAVLFARRWRQAALAAWLALFTAFRAGLLLESQAAPELTADHRPAAALIPAVPDTCARILLIAPAAPPAPVTAIAGATG